MKISRCVLCMSETTSHREDILIKFILKLLLTILYNSVSLELSRITLSNFRCSP